MTAVAVALWSPWREEETARRLAGWLGSVLVVAKQNERDAVSKVWWSTRGGLRPLRCTDPRRGVCREKA